MAKKKPAGDYVEAPGRSMLLQLMYKGLGKLKNLLRESSILQFCSSYDRIEEYSADSFLVRTCRGLKDKFRRRLARKPRRELGTEQLSPKEVGIFVPSTLPRSFKNRLGEAMEDSVVLHKAKAFLNGLLYVPMMSYGVFFFSFGLFTTVMQALLYFLLRPSESAALDLFVGLALVLLSLPIMFKGYEPMIDHFRDSITGNLLFRALRSVPEAGRSTKTSKPTFLLFLAGMVVGLLTYFAPPLNLLLLIALLVAALCVLYVPETGVCLILFLLPFFTDVAHASVLCAIAILYTGLCFLLKVIVGRRSFSFNLTDGVVLLFGLIVLSTGLAGGKSSAHSALLYAAMISGYFTLSNLLRNPAWIKRSVAALTMSSLVVSVTGILDHFWDFGVRIALLSDHAVATFYLLAVTVPVLVMLLQSERKRGRLWYFLIFAVNIAYLLLLRSPIGIFALSVELLVFFLFYTRKIWTVLLLFLLALPFVSYVIWPDFGLLGDQIFASGRIELWRALGGVFANAPLTGIGMSDQTLLNVISQETTVGLSLGSTWLRLLVQVGIPGLLVFTLFILLWYVSGFTLLRKFSVKNRAIGMHLALMSSLTGLLIAGGIAYLWNDNRLLLLFWMIAGIARALQRDAKRNEDAKEKIPLGVQSDGVQYADIEMTFSVPKVDEMTVDPQISGKDEVL